MAWTVPATYTNGQIVTNTNLNTDHRDNLRELWHEVAYVEFTANVTVLNTTTELAPVDIVSSGALTYTAVPIVVEFFTPCVNVTGATTGLSLWDGTTDLGRMADGTAGGNPFSDVPVLASRRTTPTAASHTYKVRAFSVGGGTVYGGAGGVGVRLPGYIRVWQKGG